MLPMKTRKKKTPRNSVKKVTVDASKCPHFWDELTVTKSLSISGRENHLFKTAKKARGVVVFVVDVAFIFTLVLQNSLTLSHQEEITKITLFFLI